MVIAALMITFSCLTVTGCKKKEEPTLPSDVMKKAGEAVEETGEEMQDAAEDAQK